MNRFISIKDFDYQLDDSRIAKFPLAQRDSSKLLIYKDDTISHTSFGEITNIIPQGSLVIRNNTRVIQARLVFFKPSGARVEIFCLEPHHPADYQMNFSQRGAVEWVCMVGNLKRWKSEPLTMTLEHEGEQISLVAERVGECSSRQIVRFSQDSTNYTFGQILEICGKLPIPPYLNRETEDSDLLTYQTLYSKQEGSVAAPTAGLHFTPDVFERIEQAGCRVNEVTLHVGAGTFLPVKAENAAEHQMHAEHFEFTLELLREIVEAKNIVAIGTTSVRTIESISVLGYRTMQQGSPQCQRVVGQWEAYDIPADLTRKELFGALIEYMQDNSIESFKAVTAIMIVPDYQFRVIDTIVTNFHQPQSTLLLLISAIVGKQRWRDLYNYALDNDFRFLSYGDSSILFL